MRIWAKIIKDNKILKDMVVENNDDDTRTHKVFGAINRITTVLDLSTPIWLDVNIKDFKKHSKVKFTQDSFIEEIPFDYLELQVIEED